MASLSAIPARHALAVHVNPKDAARDREHPQLPRPQRSRGVAESLPGDGVEELFKRLRPLRDRTLSSLWVCL